MEQSSELKEFYLRICQAMSNADHAFFESHFSQRDGVLAIGTDPAEWWSGYSTITRVFREQLEEAGGFKLLADSPEAFHDGSIGWLAGRPVLKLSGGTELPMRLTAVLHKEQADWKIVQWHFSAGIANNDLIGQVLTTE
ncbi:nuclear transport factor 2 family protein [Mariprofundus ferrooxydans]|uniref:nuclear transport factor 2 family protein n=1 Tax=Mariprofundus ferrooxydans TaxID=314344 RepID=UPI00035CEC2F|nr:nuclear transport factor 2 family protein [Mariprofundus ferrooxydans]